MIILRWLRRDGDILPADRRAVLNVAEQLARPCAARAHDILAFPNLDFAPMRELLKAKRGRRRGVDLDSDWVVIGSCVLSSWELLDGGPTIGGPKITCDQPLAASRYTTVETTGRSAGEAPALNVTEKSMFSTLRKSMLSIAVGVVIAFASLAPAPAHAGSASNYLINKTLDFLLRGQTFTPPATVYVGLATSTGSPAACGTEVTGGAYARVAVTSSETNWAGTQGATTTAASSGTSGTTSNNIAITFPSPTANWGTVTEFCVFDAATSGNLLFRAALTTPQTINNGAAAPSFTISALTGTIN